MVCQGPKSGFVHPKPGEVMKSLREKGYVDSAPEDDDILGVFPADCNSSDQKISYVRKGDLLATAISVRERVTSRRPMDPILLLGIILIVAVALTWVIPAGQYERSSDSQNGRTQVVPGSYLPPQARHELKEVGWTKGLELAKVARRDGQHFDCATWLHKARELRKEDFRREVEKELTGKETEPSELIYFKVYKSQIPVIEQAIETAALMLGTDKSRGYCLEMICADFLAGAHLDNGDPEILLNSISRYYKFLPGEQRQAFLENLREKAS
jgi:hypothetical protein